MNLLAVILPFASAVFFPWPLTALLALGATYYEPLVPLAVGIFADTLYFAPGSGFPVWSALGLVATVAAYFFRSRFQMR